MDLGQLCNDCLPGSSVALGGGGGGEGVEGGEGGNGAVYLYYSKTA